MPTTTISFCRHLTLHCRQQSVRFLATTRALKAKAAAHETETNAPKVTKEKVDLLSDEKLQKKMAELELPLKSASRSIGDSHSILIDAIEAFRPRKKSITKEQLEDTKEKLKKAFRLDQLNQYLTVNEIAKTKSRSKAQVLNIIFDKIWDIRAEESIRSEKPKDQLKQHIKASKQELFFIIGDHGNTIKTIEEKYDVKITIDVEKSLYIIEGKTDAVEAAQKETLAHKIIEEEMDLSLDLDENATLKTDIANSFKDISKTAKTYISFHPVSQKKIQLSSLDPQNLANAKRLLNLMFTELDQNGKASLDKSDAIFVRKPSDFSIIPFSETNGMTFYDEASVWSRLVYSNDSQDEEYQSLDGTKLESFEHIRETLFRPLESSVSDTFSLQARFGHLLFKNDLQKFNYTSLADIYRKNRNMFFKTMPPFSLVQSLIPCTHNFHEKIIQAEYIDQSLLISTERQQSEEPCIKRLIVEFVVSDNGPLELKNIIGEKTRSVVDLLNAEGNIDVRLTAKECINYAQTNSADPRLEELASRCALTRSNQLRAPSKFALSSNTTMILNDITSTLKKAYTYDDYIINLNHIEQQDRKVKRTELMLNTADYTTSLSSLSDKWPNFLKAFTDIASQWTYQNKLF